MKSLRFALLMLSVFLMVFSGVYVEAQDRNFKVALHIPPKGPTAEAIKWQFDEISRRTNNALKFELFYSQSLLPWPRALDGISKGVADFGIAAGVFTVNKNPFWSTIAIPGTGKDIWALVAASYELYTTNPKIQAEFKKWGVVPTHGYAPGSIVIAFRNPVSSVADMKGLRCRAFGGTASKMVAAMGMVPVPVKSTETYQSLDTGVVDAAFSSMTVVYAFKWYEVGKHIYYLDRNMLADSSVLANQKVWDSLSTEQQEVIKAVGSDFTDKYARILIENESRWRKEAEATGARFYEFSPEQKELSAQAAAKVRQDWFEKYDKKNEGIKAFGDTVIQTVKKYEKIVSEKGYPWQR